MRLVYLFMTLYVGLFLSGCSLIGNDSVPMQDQTPAAKINQAAILSKDPLAVAVYVKKQPLSTPYTVVGKATISKYNLCGIKRQEATIHDAMRKLAASMGGDAVINLNKSDKTVTGTVIAYQKNFVQPASLHSS